MEEKEFVFENLTCCSIEFFWKDRNKENDANNSYDYQLYQKEDKNRTLIYEGKDTRFEVINLKPNTKYIFKLKTLKSQKCIEKKKIEVTTLKAPSAILSENSDQTAIGEGIEKTENLIESQKKIINACNKLIFEEKDDNIIKGDFDGIEIKIANLFENNININFISFDIKSNYFNDFFNQFVDECENDVLIPLHFIIPKLPTILILDLLKKGPVILTGKRMGGVIASSLAFYIMYVEKIKKLEINYGNPFIKQEKNCIGVVTFGSPLFLNNLTVGIKMKKFAPYFINIKEEFDFVPEIVDLINKKEQYYKNLMNIIQKTEFNEEELNFLKIYLSKKNKIIHDINKYGKIPFGNYYKLETTNFSLIKVNEYSFMKFYNFITSDLVNSISNKIHYEKLSINIQIDFYISALEFLENKELQLEYVKIIRRIKEEENKINLTKGIIKFGLTLVNHNIISPDIINKIILISSTNKKYEINNKDIYYDNDTDITAYIDNLNENINEVFIINNFGGEMKAKNIINVQGSGSTNKMIKNNVEKLFLIPFLKLFEIFYSSIDNEGKKK